MTVTNLTSRSSRFVLEKRSSLGFFVRMNLKELKAKLLNRTVSYIGTQDEFIVIVLDDGTRLAICRDEEMNGSGALVEI